MYPNCTMLDKTHCCRGKLQWTGFIVRIIGQRSPMIKHTVVNLEGGYHVMLGDLTLEFFCHREGMYC